MNEHWLRCEPVPDRAARASAVTLNAHAGHPTSPQHTPPCAPAAASPLFDAATGSSSRHCRLSRKAAVRVRRRPAAALHGKRKRSPPPTRLSLLAQRSSAPARLLVCTCLLESAKWITEPRIMDHDSPASRSMRPRGYTVTRAAATPCLSRSSSSSGVLVMSRAPRPRVAKLMNQRMRTIRRFWKPTR
jgi:hypothetical protein